MPFIPTDYSQIQKQIKSEKENYYWGGYYKSGVYGSTPTQKKMFSGRILPAFDYSLSMADTTFQTSWAPYRNKDNIDPETNQPVLNAFFAVVSAYSWFGNKQVSFLSPSTLRFTHNINRGPELIDPLQDIRNFAKKHEDPAIRAMTERPANNKEAKIILPYPSRRYVFNFYGTAGTDRNQRNYLIDVSPKAFEDLAGKLSEWRPAHEHPLDPNWPNYLYGDITDPNNGIMVDTVSIPSNPQPFNGFVFTSGSHKSTKGVRQSPVPVEALAGRYHLYGDNSAFKILSAQEIVDFLVEDGSVPYHLIQEVCSNYANVPAQPSKAKVFAGDDNDEENEYMPAMVTPFTNPSTRAYTNNLPKTPDSSPPWSAPTPAPMPAAPAAQKKFWVLANGQKYSDSTLEEKQVQSIIMGNPEKIFMVCAENTTTWMAAIDAGFSVPPKPQQMPAPPVPAAPPAMPTMPSFPSFPSPSVAPAAPPMVQVTPAEANEINKLSKEEQDRFQLLQDKFKADNISAGELSEYISFVHRMEKP